MAPGGRVVDRVAETGVHIRQHPERHQQRRQQRHQGVDGHDHQAPAGHACGKTDAQGGEPAAARCIVSRMPGECRHGPLPFLAHQAARQSSGSTSAGHLSRGVSRLHRGVVGGAVDRPAQSDPEQRQGTAPQRRGHPGLHAQRRRRRPRLRAAGTAAALEHAHQPLGGELRRVPGAAPERSPGDLR